MKKNRKLIHLVMAIVATLLCCNFLLYANATSSEIDKVSEIEEASPSEIFEDNDDEELSDGSESDVEESEDDQAIDTSISSPSDAKSDDVVEEDFESESFATPSETEAEIESDEIVSTPSDANDMLLAPRFGAPTPMSTIYMYLDGTVVHFTSQTLSPAGSATTAYVSDTGGGMNNMINFLYTTASIDCSNITNVVIDEDLYPTNCRAMFSSLSGITGVTNLNKLHTDFATNIGGMFTGCTNITSLDISHFVVTNVCTNTSYMFAGTGISSISFGNWDTSGVTDMSDMFYGCPNLTSLDLTKFNTSSVINFRNMFYHCENLNTINLNSFDTSSATDMIGMFSAGIQSYGPPVVYHPSSLVNIYVSPSFVAAGTTIDMFAGCTQLPGYDPANVDGSMLSTYTKSAPTPTPTPPPSADDRRYRGGSSGGGGGGGGRISLQNTNEIVLHTIKTNLISNYKIDGSYNFLSNDDGKTIVKKAWVNSDIHLPNSWYLVDNDGTVVTGFAKVSGKYYYFSPEKNVYGMMLANTSISINGITYTLASDGTCASSNLPTNYYDIDFYLGGNKGLVTHNGYYYYFDDEGNICTGLYPLNDGLYYFQKDMPEKGKLICGDIFVDGVHYFCDPNAGGKARIIS